MTLKSSKYSAALSGCDEAFFEAHPTGLARRTVTSHFERDVHAITTLSEGSTIMADDSRFYRGMFLLTFVFGAGFVCGYQFKTWRLEWLKRRRERLAVKLQDTQKQIEGMGSM